MSQIDDVLTKVRAVAFTGGLPKLAKDSGIPERTLRRFLKNPPKQILTLKRLEEIVDTDAAAAADPA